MAEPRNPAQSTRNAKLTRRRFVQAGAVAAAAPFVVPHLAPGFALPNPGWAAAAAAQGAQPREVPRNRTLVLRWGGQEGRYIDHELWNNYAIGASHQNGLGIFYEPLAFYSAFADETVFWLAESAEYNADSTELRITTRPNITWSDGTPFSAEDVAYTLNTLRDLGAQVKWGVDVQQFVQEAIVESPTVTLVRFKVPAPRFFYFMSYKFDIGIQIVPRHIYEGQDWSAFKAFDLAAGQPITTGPWQVVFSSPDQKVIDRRDAWWAVDAGLVEALPQVERIIYLPFADETQVAQQLISNQIDCSLDLRPLTMETLLRQNPAITTHTGQELPYGYVDWWPTSLYVNNEVPPYDDPDVRWALSSFIDRDQVIQVALAGAGSPSRLPMPSYPGLEPFVETIEDLLQQYPTNEFAPEKGAARLEAKGWAKNGDGFWEREGQVLGFDLLGFNIFADIGPVIAEQLRQQGVEAEFSMPPDLSDQIQRGNYTAALFGHGGSVGQDPYFTLRLYQSVSATNPSGQANVSRWRNADYDRIVDEMAVTSIEDQAALLDQFRRAMEIWLPQLPDIQIQEWYHRIPMNTTYWQGWPTQEDPYVNGAFWAMTFQLILNRLTPAQ